MGSPALTKFCEDTDTHGIKFLIDGSSSHIRKVFWVVLIIGSFAFLGYFFSYRVTDYLRHDVTTKVSMSRGKVSLPSVKVCFMDDVAVDATMLTAHDIVNADSAEKGRLGLDETGVIETRADGQRYLTSEAIGFFRNLVQDPENKTLVLESRNWFDHGTSETEPSEINWQVLLTKLIEHGFETPLQVASEYNETEVMERTQYNDVDGFMITCTAHQIVNGIPKETSCNRGWKFVTVNGGRCFTRHQTEADGVLKLDPLIVGRNPDTFVFPNSPSRLFSILVETDTEAWETAFDRRMVNSVQPGMWEFIRVQEKTEVRRLGYPFGNCIGEEDYSESRCTSDCVREFVKNELGCRYARTPKDDLSLPLCWQKFNNWQQQRHLGQYGICAGRCPPVCSENTFVISSVDTVPSPMHDGFSEHLMFYYISSDDMTKLVHLDEMELYPLGSLLAELGGTMGLFIGISLLSIVHFIEFLVTIICMKNCANSQTVDEEMKSRDGIGASGERLVTGALLRSAINDLREEWDRKNEEIESRLRQKLQILEKPQWTKPDQSPT